MQLQAQMDVQAKELDEARAALKQVRLFIQGKCV
jgi:hypothetical protein